MYSNNNVTDTGNYITSEQVQQIAQDVANIVGTNVIEIDENENRYCITTDFATGGGFDFSIPKQCSVNSSTSVYFHGDGSDLYGRCGSGINARELSENSITGDQIVFYPRNESYDYNEPDDIDLIKNFILISIPPLWAALY